MIEISTVDIIVRMTVATVLSGLIGIEREWHEKPAGIRTNVMVGLGACLIALASVQIPNLWPDIRPIDPGRIAAQIISGIGFIGAGAILRSDRGAIVGLTTAATLWVVAGLGMTIGFGFYVEAIVATALVFFTFIVLGQVVKRIRYTTRHGDGHQVGESSAHTEGRSAGENE
ncbi:MgtC/SapB family protein [Candidatus Uhrbacteria bacterium]|nr:MgtC/SapB family protein [Candidatus Uhrbacteria bacterium]